ncbi:MAG TPA: hypothetical protein VLL52_18695 [Anaerolineae bacterium]|nr:hypothetical protein [Anaerolineae bacterium]
MSEKMRLVGEWGENGRCYAVTAKEVSWRTETGWLVLHQDNVTTVLDGNSGELVWETEGWCDGGSFSDGGEKIALYQVDKGRLQILDGETKTVLNEWVVRDWFKGEKLNGGTAVVTRVRWQPGSQAIVGLQIQFKYRYSSYDDRYERMAQDRMRFGLLVDVVSGELLWRQKGSFFDFVADGRYAHYGMGSARDTSLLSMGDYERVASFSNRESVLFFNEENDRVAYWHRRHGWQVLALPSGERVASNEIDWLQGRFGFVRGLATVCELFLAEEWVGMDYFRELGAYGRLVLGGNGRYVAAIDKEQQLHIRQTPDNEGWVISSPLIASFDKIVFCDGKLLVAVWVPTHLWEKRLEQLA